MCRKLENKQNVGELTVHGHCSLDQGWRKK